VPLRTGSHGKTVKSALKSTIEHTNTFPQRNFREVIKLTPLFKNAVFSVLEVGLTTVKVENPMRMNKLAAIFVDKIQES